MIWQHGPEAAAAFAAAVLVPAAVRVLDEPDRHGRRAWTIAAARALSLPAGTLAAVSFLAPAGPAFVLCAPYLAVAVLVALHGAARLARGGPASEIGIGAGAFYLGGAAIWLCAHRAGYALLAYPPYWVALTATHFHVAGLVLCLAAGMSARRGGPLASLAVALVVIGVPATAITMYWSPRLEPYAALLMATGATLVALRHLVPPRRTLGAVGGVVLIGGMVMAAQYALRLGWTVGGLDALETMVVTHGIANLVFAAAVMGALAIERPRPDWVRGTPLSRITARGRIGADFFERMGMVRGEARGTVDRIEDMRNARFDGCDAEIARFFERVGGYRIAIVPRWRFPFGIGARVWRGIARRLGQLALPVEAGEVRSRVVGLDAAHDGRAAPRAWIREDAGGGAMFVSAYATTGHYMNVAFPLPGMQMTSINRFVGTAGGGVLVTSAKDGAGCDCGCWLVLAGVAFRLPIREDIRLWTPGMAELPADLRVPPDAALVGRQRMRLAGLRFLTIDYAIAREPDEARIDVARDPAPPEA